VHNQSIIMPMLFFIFGMFVVPSLLRRGLWGYLKERFLRLGTIYIIGVPLIVPLLSYPKYEQYDEPGIGYMEFWREVFFGERMQAGPFWVFHAILGYTLLLLAIYYFLPPLYRLFVRFFKWCFESPVLGYIAFGALSTLILFISDVIWGSPWWTNFGFIFSLQSSRMVLVFLYFLAGSALMYVGFLRDEDFMARFSNQWPKFLGLYVILAGAFMYYTTAHYSEAYNEEVRFFVYQHGGWMASWSDLWPIFKEFSPPILLKTFLYGFLCMTQALLLLAVFHKFVAVPTHAWTSLARNALGIFVLHETIVVWLQYYMIGLSIPIFVKFLICAVVGISASWFISAKILLKIPIVERILSPKPREVA
jgi:glucans biosynthesis protein C